jgi:hypothetical protein
MGDIDAGPSSPSPAPLVVEVVESTSKKASTPRKASTFRRIPLRDSKPPLGSSPLRPPVVPVATPSLEAPGASSPPPTISKMLPLERSPNPTPIGSPLRPASLELPKVSPKAPSSKSPMPNPHNVPYRPGFQPKGVYRDRTDEFAAVRRVTSDRGRIERSKLERRLEKLIDLHFPREAVRAVHPPAHRRASSFFDFDISDLKNVGAGGLWKGMLQSPKADIRGISRFLGLRMSAKSIVSHISFSVVQLQNNGLHHGKTMHPYQSVPSARECAITWYDLIYEFVHLAPPFTHCQIVSITAVFVG